MELRNRVETEKNYIDPSTIFKGLEYYRFLMESLPPASTPGLILNLGTIFIQPSNKLNLTTAIFVYLKE